MGNNERLINEILDALQAENGVTIRITIEPIRQTQPASIKKAWIEKEVEEILLNKISKLGVSQIITNLNEMEKLVNLKNSTSFRRMHVANALDKLCMRKYGKYTLSDPGIEGERDGFYYIYTNKDYNP